MPWRAPQLTNLRFESGDQQTALIELYTSEGCSSCPPAEAWLSKLKSDPGLWKDFVPLAFHVDYWDRLGWRDRFAASEWTQRQYTYVSLLRTIRSIRRSLFVNGDEWRDWFRKRVVAERRLSRAGILSATTTDEKKFVDFVSKDKTSGLEAHVALLGCGINTKIGGGENNGRQLQHDFVVLENRADAMPKTPHIPNERIVAIEKIEQGHSAKSGRNLDYARETTRAIAGDRRLARKRLR